MVGLLVAVAAGAVADDLCITAEALNDDVYLVRITSADERAETSDVLVENATTSLCLSPATLELAVFRRGVDGEAAGRIWSGCLEKLEHYGAAEQPGLQLSWRAAPNEAIYGLGQRFNGLDQAGERCAMWIVDKATRRSADGADSYFCTPVCVQQLRLRALCDGQPRG